MSEKQGRNGDTIPTIEVKEIPIKGKEKFLENEGDKFFSKSGLDVVDFLTGDAIYRVYKAQPEKNEWRYRKEF